MKKLSILCLAMALVFGAQAQFGNLGKSVQRSVEKKVEKKAMQKADQEIDKALDKAFGLDKSQQQKSESKSDVQRETPSADIEDGKLPTPEDVMASVPALPSYQNIAEYLCEQNRENPRPLKLMTNPTTAFLTNMAIAAASGKKVPKIVLRWIKKFIHQDFLNAYFEKGDVGVDFAWGALKALNVKVEVRGEENMPKMAVCARLPAIIRSAELTR